MVDTCSVVTLPGDADPEEPRLKSWMNFDFAEHSYIRKISIDRSEKLDVWRQTLHVGLPSTLQDFLDTRESPQR